MCCVCVLGYIDLETQQAVVGAAAATATTAAAAAAVAVLLPVLVYTYLRLPSALSFGCHSFQDSCRWS